MGKTSEVDALVTAGGSTTKVTKEVKVTIGGCGDLKYGSLDTELPISASIILLPLCNITMWSM
jgi:hypothetical protein